MADKASPHTCPLSPSIIRLVTDIAVQVTFETTAAGAEAEELPSPVWLLMHGAEGVTPPLQFEPTPEGGVAVYERNAEAVGELSQLTVWLQPSTVSILACCVSSAVSCYPEDGPNHVCTYLQP